MAYDVAVIGAGSAGAVVAARLSEDPDRSVALIEAGPDYPDFETLPDELKYGRATAAYVSAHHHLWSLTARGVPGSAPTPLPRGRVVGGTSAVNGQVFLRAVRDDFRVWADRCPRWSFAEVLPYYVALENDLDFDDEWHGRRGPVPVRRYPSEEWLPAQRAFLEACTALGHPECPDANRPDAVGVGPVPFNNVDGIRASSALTHLAPARARPNLHVLANTFVRQMRIVGGAVVGLDVESDGKPAVIEADSYVLSAGAIGSPHLLMVSGIGPAARLREIGVDVAVDLPGVGHGLRDHQLVDLVWRTRTAPPDGRVWQPLVQMALRYTSSDAEYPDDMQITVRSAVPGRAAEPLMALVPSIEHSAALGEVSLVSPDPHVQPAIELRFADDPRDVRRLREAVEICREMAAQPAFAGIVDRPVEPEAGADVGAWLRRRVRTSHHVCGSCAMGPDDDPDAVVDQFGAVRGVDNLRIADASVFPDVIRANPHATTLMVGERIASFIRDGE